MQKKLISLYTDPLYRNSIALMLNSAIGAFFGLLFWIVAARTMTAKDIGLATAAISAAALIVGLSRLGLDQGLVRYLPESNNKSGLYSTIVTATLILAIFFTGVFIIGMGIFSPALSFLGNGWFLPVFFVYVAVSSISTLQNTAFIAIRRADFSLLQNLLLGIRIPILLLIASFGVFGIFSALGSAFVIALLFGAFILQKNGLWLEQSLDITALLRTLKFSLGNYTAGIFSMVPTTLIPLMIVNTIGAEENAYFYIANSIAALLIMIPIAVSTSLFVEGSYSLPLKENVFKSMKLILMFQVPGLVFIFIFGDKLLVLFSREYSEQSFEMLRLLAVSSLFSAITLIYISIKRIQKNVRMVNYVNFVLSVLILGLGYIFLLKYGLVGLGYAWLSANVMISIYVIWLARREGWI